MKNEIMQMIKKMSSESEEQFRQTKKKWIDNLSEKIIEYVKTNNCEFDFTEISKLCKDEEIINTIKGRVTSKTVVFLESIEFRNFAKDLRQKYYDDTYKGSFIEKETFKFISEINGLDKNVVPIVGKILSMSEEIIYFKDYSKRRYIECIHDISGLCAEDAEYIWNLFTVNLTTDYIINRKLTRLDAKIERIRGMVGLVEERVDILGEIMCDMFDMLNEEREE